MEKEFESEGFVHIVFPLKKDENDYPPARSERLWAKKVDDNLFEIDNTPFFVTGLACGDKVSTEEKDGVLYYQDTKEYSGNSTLRVVAHELEGRETEELIKELREELEKLGCDTELSHIPNLIAVNVPKDISLKKIINYLAEGEKEGRWGYEEACLGQEL